MPAMVSDNFLQKFATVLIRQERQLRSGEFLVGSKDSGFKSVAETISSRKYRDHFEWSKEGADENSQRN